MTVGWSRSAGALFAHLITQPPPHRADLWLCGQHEKLPDSTRATASVNIASKAAKFATDALGITTRSRLADTRGSIASVLIASRSCPGYTLVGNVMRGVAAAGRVGQSVRERTGLVATETGHRCGSRAPTHRKKGCCAGGVPRRRAQRSEEVEGGLMRGWRRRGRAAQPGKPHGVL